MVEELHVEQPASRDRHATQRLLEGSTAILSFTHEVQIEDELHVGSL